MAVATPTPKPSCGRLTPRVTQCAPPGGCHPEMLLVAQNIPTKTKVGWGSGTEGSSKAAVIPSRFPSMFAEACMGYGEGLNHHAHNALLLCNRAARRCKLGHYEKVVEDCSTALVVPLSYSTARLRRADSNAKVTTTTESMQS
ncbi:hypothetical protein BHM03_00037446 [Ensete ventricosum]|nr:hypothetical protein BHM03_00037446 [Ensete ventricosum]